MPRANVRSLDSVQRFQPKISQFEDDLGAALTSLRVEINRTLQWIDHDCPQYWQNQVRGGFDRVAEARTTLMRKQMITIAGHRSECIDEKKALAKAKQNLEIERRGTFLEVVQIVFELERLLGDTLLGRRLCLRPPQHARLYGESVCVKRN